MKLFRFFLLLICVAFYLQSNAQFMEPKINPDDPALPGWVKLMYADNPNIYRVDSAYQAYYRLKPFIENSYTRYYMRWRTALSRVINEEGFITPLSAPARIKLQDEIQSLRGKNNKSTASSQWSFAGPEVHMRAKYAEGDSVFPLSEQANTYCIDQSVSDPDVLFCGTESGGVYKSVDKGANWTLVSQGLLIYSVSAIAINPTDENEILFGGLRFYLQECRRRYQLATDRKFRIPGLQRESLAD